MESFAPNESIIFAGPDLKPDRLSKELSRAILNTPDVGTIYWLCYYFRNTSLFANLNQAADRGISVSVLMEKQPRYNSLNSPIPHLQASFISTASKTPWWHFIGIRWKPRLHEKIYYFSHPFPYVYIGSYNPSDDESNSETFNKEVGNHAISHNVLVKISEPEVVAFIYQHCKNMHRRVYRALSRYWPDRTTSFLNGHYQVFLWPRLRSPFHKIARNLQPGDRVRAAVSHLKGPGVLAFFKKAQNNGVKVELLLDDTERRVPAKMIRKLNKLGIQYSQLNLPANCLMHNKFVLIDQQGSNSVIFGSMNWSTRSQWLNHEIAIRTDEVTIVQAFEERWMDLICSKPNE